MAYIHEICALADKFKEDVSFNITKDFKFKIYIKNVFYKTAEDLKTVHHMPIFGLGWTLEDASNDFFRRSRGGYLYHCITDQMESII